jgi:hypothetical protein
MRSVVEALTIGDARIHCETKAVLINAVKHSHIIDFEVITGEKIAPRDDRALT